MSYRVPMRAQAVQHILHRHHPGVVSPRGPNLLTFFMCVGIVASLTAVWTVVWILDAEFTEPKYIHEPSTILDVLNLFTFADSHLTAAEVRMCEAYDRALADIMLVLWGWLTSCLSYVM
jgi:ligand-binding SRPBCC domain-containing protein